MPSDFGNQAKPGEGSLFAALWRGAAYFGLIVVSGNGLYAIFEPLLNRPVALAAAVLGAIGAPCAWKYRK